MAPSKSSIPDDSDTYSLLSQATTTMTIGDSLPAQLVRKSARKGFTFNIMSVGPPNLGKTALLSALFSKNLEISHEGGDTVIDDPINPPIKIMSKTFELDDKRVRLKLTLVESRNYGEAIALENPHKPLVRYIDSQFADYHKREYSFDRRNIQDKMIHCVFFFISPIGHGLSRLDLEFLKAIHNRANIIPIIAKAEALTATEREIFKGRIQDDLKRHNIRVYQMPDADPEDCDDMKKIAKEIQESMPFAVTSINWKTDGTISDRCLGWSTIDPFDRNHSDFLLLKTMLHMQMPDLCDSTHEVFYEEYRLRTVDGATVAKSS